MHDFVIFDHLFLSDVGLQSNQLPLFCKVCAHNFLTHGVFLPSLQCRVQSRWSVTGVFLLPLDAKMRLVHSPYFLSSHTHTQAYCKIILQLSSITFNCSFNCADCCI